jgi:integrase
MPKLTIPAIEKYAAQAKRREIRDTQAPGLYLVIQPRPSGAKSWAVRFRRPDGRPAKLTLGSVYLGDEPTDEPAIGGALTLLQARALAAQLDRERARGIDVVEERKAEHRRKQSAAADRAANTFGAAMRSFFGEYRTRRGERARRWRDDAALLGLRYPLGCDPATAAPEITRGSLADTWAGKPIADIDGHNIHTVVDEAHKLGSPGRARKLHAALSVLFRWLVQQRRIAGNPATGVYRPGPPPARERVLSDAEIVAFWRVCDRIGMPYGAMFKLLLLTGCRLREVANMQCGELNGEGVWHIPGSRTKNHRSLSLPLPPLALEIIAAVPTIESDAGFVFTVDGRRSANGFGRAKQQLDAAMSEELGYPVPSWRLHDLRRTCASSLAKLGVQLPVIEKVLNHVSGSFGGVAGIYQRHSYAAEKREALERWAAHIIGLISDKPANVTALAARRKQQE